MTDTYIDWSRVVAMVRTEEGEKYTKNGAKLYCLGGHVLVVHGKWEELKAKFDRARQETVDMRSHFERIFGKL